MKYIRPDMIKIKNDFNHFLKSFNEAGNFEEAEKALDGIVSIKKEFETMRVICFIRHSVNTIEKIYTDEKNFFDNNEPDFNNLYNNFYKALTESKFKEEIITGYGDQIFNIAEKELQNTSAEILEDKIKENSLCTEYIQLTASAKVIFKGKEMNLQSMYPYWSSTDRETRKESFNSYYKFYEDNSQNFDSIFTKLVTLRNDMAHKLGYKNFVELGYSLLNRTDYDPEMIKNFGENIHKYFFPLRNTLKEKKRIRLGLDEVKFYDTPIHFKSGNAEPKGNSEWIVNKSKKMFGELSPETKEFFEFMTKNELMDLDRRDGKSGGGFCTFIYYHKSPYIFANMNGTQNDIDVMIHEGGHAFQSYASRNFYFPEYLTPTAETCEIHSIGMEFFAYPWIELFFEEDAEKYKFTHLSSNAGMLSFEVMVDIFQIWVYENPTASDSDRNSKWKELRDKYLFNTGYEEFPFLNEGNDWKDVFHIFVCPFYYIDYAIAGICALQLWSKAIKNKNFSEAWSDYLKLCKLGGSMSFLQLIKAANLESPFNEEIIKRIAGEVEEYLDNTDDKAF